MKYVFESYEPITFREEDSGMSLCLETGEVDQIGVSDPECGINIQINHWDMNREHMEFRKFEGKRFRVTLEVID